MQLENGLSFELEPLERLLARMQSAASEVRPERHVVVTSAVTWWLLRWMRD